MLKTLAGLVLAFALGAVCRWVDVPVPAPNRLTGALLVLAITLGYLGADWAIRASRDDPGPRTPAVGHDGPASSPNEPAPRPDPSQPDQPRPRPRSSDR